MSRESRGAREVLVEIRSVINHLELQDSVLNEELKVWKSKSSGSDIEKIKGLLEKNLKLQEQLKQIGDYSSKQMQEISHLQDENTNLRESISAKDMEINKLKRDLSFEKSNVKLLEKKNEELNEILEKSQSDLRGTKEELESYITNEGHLKSEILQLKQAIKQIKQSGRGALADSTSLTPPHSPQHVTKRVDFRNPENPNVSANADISHKNDENQHAAQEGGGVGSLLVRGVGSTVRGVANAVINLGRSKGGVHPTTTADGRGGQDSGSANSENNDRSDVRDETPAGSPSRGPDEVSHPYIVKDDNTQVGGGGAATGDEGRGTAAITADGRAGGGGGGQTQVLANNEDVIKMKAKELSTFITSRRWSGSENSYTSKYKCFLKNESLDILKKYKLKYNLLGDDRESIIHNLNKIAFECNVLESLGAPDYREMKAKYTRLPEEENRKTPPKDKIAEGLSKMDHKQRSQLTRDICVKKLTSIPDFVAEALKCDIHIDKSRTNGSVRNLYPQVYEVPLP